MAQFGTTSRLAVPRAREMILSLFRRSANERVIERLYAGMVAASRVPALYADLAISDTFEGRFESLTLHAAIVVCRLRDAEPPGPDMGQHLVDAVFRHFDRMLREQGVGDTAVPKRMKRLAEAFLGRSAAYDRAFQLGPVALEETLRRNVYQDRHDANALARYVLAAREALRLQPLQTFVDGVLAFPDPAESGRGKPSSQTAFEVAS